MSEWDRFAKSLSEQETAVRNMDATVMQAGADDDKLAVLYVKIEEMMDALKAQRTVVANQLAANVRQEVGSFPRTTPDGKYTITISWPAKHEWDEDQLKAIVGAGNVTLPAFVDEKIKIDKKAWEKADPAERAPYLPALTVKPGTRDVKVEAVA